MFKGSNRPRRFFGLKALHTTRNRDPAHDTPAGGEAGDHRLAVPLGVQEFQTHFLPPPHGKAMRPACFLRIPWSTFFLYTEHLSSILEGNSWYVYPFPAVRGGCYGASGSHLCTPGSQPYGALHRDRGAPGDLPRLAHGRPRGHRLTRVCAAGV